MVRKKKTQSDSLKKYWEQIKNIRKEHGCSTNEARVILAQHRNGHTPQPKKKEKVAEEARPVNLVVSSSSAEIQANVHARINKLKTDIEYSNENIAALKKDLREYENELGRLIAAEEALSGKASVSMTTN